MVLGFATRLHGSNLDNIFSNLNLNLNHRLNMDTCLTKATSMAARLSSKRLQGLTLDAACRTVLYRIHQGITVSRLMGSGLSLKRLQGLTLDAVWCWCCCKCAVDIGSSIVSNTVSIYFAVRSFMSTFVQITALRAQTHKHLPIAR